MVDSQPLSFRPFRAGTPRDCKHAGLAGLPKNEPGRLTVHASMRQNPKSTRGIEKRTLQL
jgi:hypothetical protein